MPTLFGPTRKCRGTLSRRDVLQVGALGLGGLTLADVLRLRAQAAPAMRRDKSVIMIWLRGGPSHIDSYDMKPAAPAEVRGEFHPIPTNVPGIEICEHLPLHAQIMDKLAIVRGIRSNDLGDHTPHYISTGFPDRGLRPALGSIVSHLRPRSDGLPPYVSVYRPESEGPTYLGPAHAAFVPQGEDLENLRLVRGVTLGRLEDRRNLLKRLDSLRRDADQSGTFAALDEFSTQAFEMIATPKARAALDLGQESDETRARYGRFWQSFLMSRRLVEAGVNLVTLKIGDWDTHEHNFRDMRDQLPELDRGFHALVTDLYDRGLEQDVAVVMWGEFGRAPRISRIAGRDHWPEAGAAVIAGGGFQVGQAIGETDGHAGQSTGKPYTPSNVLASVYGHLGIDPAITIPDRNNRPMHVLDDREPVRELVTGL
ncbi:MAG: DUF1501 domain-containing protein [Planctomycetes bacterium]|nr:DUF1501 domain-containing protein [Planctomycetota bacterium]